MPFNRSAVSEPSSTVVRAAASTTHSAAWDGAGSLQWLVSQAEANIATAVIPVTEHGSGLKQKSYGRDKHDSVDWR